MVLKPRPLVEFFELQSFRGEDVHGTLCFSPKAVGIKGWTGTMDGDSPLIQC